MCAPLIIATGWWSAGKTVRMGRRVACFLFIGGTVATFVEAWTLLHIYGVPLEGHDFLLATPFQVWGLLNLLRSYPSWVSVITRFDVPLFTYRDGPQRALAQWKRRQVTMTGGVFA